MTALAIDTLLLWAIQITAELIVLCVVRFAKGGGLQQLDPRWWLVELAVGTQLVSEGEA